MKKNVKRAIAIGIIGVTMSAPTLGTIYADTLMEGDKISQNKKYTNLSDSDVYTLMNFFTENKVSYSKAIELIDKVDAGKILNSMDEDFIDSEILVSSETSDSGVTKEIYRYPDGSVRVTEVERPENSVSGFSVSGGTVSGGTGYKNIRGARALESVGVVTCSFYADYTFVQGGYDMINRIYDASITTVGGNYSEGKLGNGKLNNDTNKPDKQKENSYGPAYAKLSFKFTAYGESGAQTCWMKLNVGKDRASTTSN